MKSCSTIMAAKPRGMRSLFWPELLRSPGKWKRPGSVLRRRWNLCTIPGCWLGAIYILGESLIYRKSATLQWNTIGPRWRLAIPLPIPGEQPSEGWQRHTRWERQPSHERFLAEDFLPRDTVLA